MSKKLDGYRDKDAGKDIDPIDKVVNELETKKTDLTPDPEVVVPKGDEDMPSSNAMHDESMKSLYEKSRKNRELVTREDAAGTPDVAMLQRLHAEAAGGKEPTVELDTNTPDRFAEDRGEETREQYMERLRREAEERGDEQEHGQGDTGKEIQPSAKDALPADDSDITVDVVVLGRTLSVPKQDVDDAGGVEAYQKSRSATIKLQRAATLEERARALLTQSKTEPPQSGAQQDDPSTDGLSDADIDSLHEEMMDVVVDGTVDEMKAWLQKRLLKPKTQPKPAAPSTESVEAAPQVKSDSEAAKELREQYERDRVEANTMMQSDYKDIMADPELLALAQQRFKTIKANPNSEGRTQKEMAREAANFVRNLGKRLNHKPQASDIEVERQTRIERKRNLPQPSRADSRQQPKPSQTNKVPTRKEHFMRLRQRAGQDLE